MRLDGAQNFGLLVVHRGGVERNRRLHRGQADQLKDVIRHHVAQRAGPVVIIAAQFDAEFFRHRDLHVIDVAAIPHRLENSVGEAKRQNILDRLFAEVMVDAVNLIFLQHLADFVIQRDGRGQIVAERLFDDHAPPFAVHFIGEARCAELLHDDGKKVGLVAR